VRTTPVRLANPDDVVFQGLVDEKTVATFTTENARSQARFYFATPLYRYALTSFYEIRQPWVFSLLRTAALFTQIGLAGGLLARVSRRPAWGATLALFILATLHIPLTFYPVLSYPCDWLGFTAVLIALHFHCSHLARPSLLTGLLTGVFFLLGCLMHEIFILCLPLFPAMSWLQLNAGRPGRLRANFTPLATALAYLAVYLLFARRFPSTYEGTHFSADLTAAGQVVVRQMAGIMPGFELLVLRLSPETNGPLFRGLPEIVQTVGQIPWADLLLGLLESLTLAALLMHCARHTTPLMHRWPWALGFAAFLNLPIAFAQKYQVFILHREFPYAYAFYSSFFVSFVLIATGVWCIRRLSGVLDRRLIQGFLGLTTAALCLSAMASNHRVLQILQNKFN